MKSTGRIALIAVCVCAPTSSILLSSERIDAVASRERRMKAPDEAIASCLKAVERARTDDDFYRADACIRRLPDVQTTDATARSQERRLRLDLWLRAIDKIDRTIDKKWDPRDLPQENVAPPVGAGLPAGVTPSAIKDPQLRKQYEEALKANAEKADRYRLQQLLRRLDKEWSRQMLAYVKSQYTLTGQDAVEVTDLLDKTLSDAQRKKEIKKALLLEK